MTVRAKQYMRWSKRVWIVAKLEVLVNEKRTSRTRGPKGEEMESARIGERFGLM